MAFIGPIHVSDKEKRLEVPVLMGLVYYPYVPCIEARIYSKRLRYLLLLFIYYRTDFCANFADSTQMEDDCIRAGIRVNRGFWVVF